ncbi:uncharacterized protein CCOS01_11570 [Colletotrichum costaricense]|uniref:Uncharacterized protein n=1 Tax=Colletotrichum costaricense TaxID=1209916 RepID=A0AAI9YPB3_9PEZI|nr:uncharacterized protein CCOS01_11570 [Colletotrichum costaricense]KAK1518750.1 hypothetical protein CCOS01_11570 [Colletotrichum costaricense]
MEGRGAAPHRAARDRHGAQAPDLSPCIFRHSTTTAPNIAGPLTPYWPTSPSSKLVFDPRKTTPKPQSSAVQWLILASALVSV